MPIQQVVNRSIEFSRHGLSVFFTEKRLAMELISRTMQDMQNHDNDILSDISNSDLSTTATASTPNLNKFVFQYIRW
jgi:hypothetical protein